MKKTLPILKTDEEAEEFVSTADLSEYDLSGFVPVRFVFRDDAPQANVPVPQSLLREVEQRAAREGVSSESFIRNAIEVALRSAA